MLNKALQTIRGATRNSVNDLIARGDEARDRRAWEDAASHYRAALDENPSLAPIRVQFGNMLKECGRREEAEKAYRAALALADEADTHLQLGHVLKIQGRHQEALAAYTRAVEIDPKLSDAWRELRTFGIERPSTATDPRILIDLSDVFFYLRHHSTVSGIQRVQLGLAKALIVAQQDGPKVAFLTEDHSGYVEVSSDLILKLIRTLQKSSVALEDLQIIGRQAASDGERYVPVDGDLLLILGAFWVLPNVIEQIVTLKRKGVRVGVMIHDIIPITHPEFCERDLTDTFNLYVRSVFRVVDLIISISQNTQNEIKRLLDDSHIPVPPMFLLRNAHRAWEAQRPGLMEPSYEVAALSKRNYVLYVSTIEIRKNHTLLFRIWKRLQQEAPNRVPQLVFVGRPGWRVRDLMDQIVGTEYLNGAITILHDIPDTDLEWLYRNAMFTAFPSFEEGWGLPVGESLVFGRPCVASSASSIPEVGGAFVDYVNPHDVDDAYQVFKKLVFDDQYRESRVRAIADGFKARTWEDVARELLNEMRRFDAARSDRNVIPLDVVLEPGRFHAVGHEDDRSKYINFGIGPVVHFLFDSHWYPVENFGRWLRGGYGSISFNVPASSRGTIRITLTLNTVPGYGENPLQIVVNNVQLKPFTPAADKRTTITFEATAEQTVTIGFHVRGKINRSTEVREDLTIGLISIGYAGAEDFSARLSLLEEILSSRQSFIKLPPRGNSA
jgi:glycosyltransferase involved in cell wall biosynthesis